MKASKVDYLPPKEFPELLTVNEVADKLRISKTKVYYLISHGQLRCYFVGRSKRISKQEVKNYLNRVLG